MDVQKALQENFGHSSLRDGQEGVIDSILADRSALAIFPTGGGKSLCYQLPALLLDGLEELAHSGGVLVNFGG